MNPLPVSAKYDFAARYCNNALRASQQPGNNQATSGAAIRWRNAIDSALRATKTVPERLSD